jgi:protein-S-isoprenylcysteine O-methyltransferase Ste14
MPEVEFSFRINEPLALIGTTVLFLWLCTERLLHLLGFRQRTREQRRGTLSSLWIGVSWYGAILFSFLDATTFHWTTIDPPVSAVRWLGVPLLLVGYGVRIVSRVTLGKQFSGYVQTAKGHQLVTSGIYSQIRHPAYLGFLCLLLGFPMCFGSVAGLACAIVLGIPALCYRIRIEEAALEEWFPDEYKQYKTKTHSRIIPLLW